MQPTPEIACLLIHGFTSSPSEMQGLGDYLRTRGCTVRIPTLPGHGTTPEALTKVNYQKWLDTAEQECGEMAKHSAKVFVIGESMGATLALHLAAHFHVDGVIALAPALRLPWWQAIAVYALSPLIKWRSKPNGPDVQDKSAGMRLQHYSTYPTVSIKELIKTMRLVRSELQKISAPLLIMHGRHDHTISLRNVDILRRNVRSQEIKIEIMENSSHVLTVDYDHEKVYTRVLSFIRRHSLLENTSKRQE